MRLNFQIALLLFSPSTAVAEFILVNDERGRPVPQFEVMYHTHRHGWSQWIAGGNGRALLGLPKSGRFDVFVRSDSFASAIASIERGLKDKVPPEKATITLQKGRQVQLTLRPPAGAELPGGVLPDLFFPEYASTVRIMRQPANLEFGKPDFNMFNIQRVDEGIYTFRLPLKPRKFRISLHSPGWLQFCDFGLFSIEDFKDGMLELRVPKPASLRARLNFAGFDARQLPFASATFDLMWQSPEMGNAYYSVTSSLQRPLDAGFEMRDLGPGSYYLRLTTHPKGGITYLDKAINPGRFTDVRKFELRADEAKQIVFPYVPFNAMAFTGNGSARIRVIAQDGLPASGRPIRVTYFDGHYGQLTVYDSSIPANGTVHLEGISLRSPGDVPFGSYAVEVDGKRVGFFRFDAGKTEQDFEFWLAPSAGDPAPDISLFDVASGQTTRLSEFRGKVVLLEFWATWCGPCQPAMNKLNEVAVVHEEKWNDKVAIIPISIDDTPKQVLDHVGSRGWTNLTHFWTPRDDSAYRSRAQQRYVVNGVPTSVLIDRQGRIAWRGHPLVDADGYDVAERIKRELRGTERFHMAIALVIVSFILAVAYLRLPILRTLVNAPLPQPLRYSRRTASTTKPEHTRIARNR